MRTLLLPLLLAAAGCATAGTRTRGTVPAAERTLRGEEFRVVGSTATRDGDAFDAQLLFDRAIAHMRAQRCADALPVLDQLLRQFPASAVVPRMMPTLIGKDRKSSASPLPPSTA